tara:strand:+ start:466 stop:1128 length:663 start_codon:yes stop_codon:yes gene_type:complete
MTRNTKLYKFTLQIDHEDTEVQYRTLTIKELEFLDKIINKVHKHEHACKMALLDIDIRDLNFTVIHQLGAQIIDKSASVMVDPQLFQLTVENFQATVPKDTVLNMLADIMKSMPNPPSYEFLINQTFTDLIELICFCEVLTGKKMFKFDNMAPPPPQPEAPKPSSPPRTTKEAQTNSIEDELLMQQLGQGTVNIDGHNFFPEDGKTLGDKMKADKKFYKD